MPFSSFAVRINIDATGLSQKAAFFAFPQIFLDFAEHWSGCRSHFNSTKAGRQLFSEWLMLMDEHVVMCIKGIKKAINSRKNVASTTIQFKKIL